MLPKDPVRHHRIKKIVIGIITVPTLLFLALIITGFVISVFQRSAQIKNNSLSSSKIDAQNIVPYLGERKNLIEGQSLYYLGSNNPKLTIVEFADYACPYCKSSFRGLRELAFKYQDSVKIIVRDWPGHDYSISLAMTAHCAGEQGKFWEMHDSLYDAQSDSFGADKNDLAQLASNLNIYNTQFQECFDSKKYLSNIQKNVTDAEALEVAGTPTWFFNGNKVEGELGILDLEKIIKQYVNQ